MRNVVMILITAFITVSMAGCASTAGTASGQSIVDIVSQMEKGKTTYADAIAELGKPASISKRDDVKTVTFGKAGPTLNAASYIPFVNMVAGGAKMAGTSATLSFDKNDILISKNITQY